MYIYISEREREREKRGADASKTFDDEAAAQLSTQYVCNNGPGG